MRSRPAHRKAAGDSRGFTLIETCIALLVLMAVGMGVTSAIVFAMTSNRGASNRAHANAVAQRQAEYLQNVPFTGLEAAVTASGGSPKTVVVDDRTFTVTTTITYVPTAATATLKTVIIEVRPQGDPAAWANAPVRFRFQRVTQTIGLYSK
jgi:Tfp pilus assembly protein PilV